ncbi:hypothetical protein [Shouchella shacheensis]|uniref:hypothetical protein n=1 Tax=Shouchella shacheensis TaxID=1649580 RepID=UPI00073FD9DE|nr:hypothetical protein [Shouchella shacheensis]
MKGQRLGVILLCLPYGFIAMSEEYIYGSLFAYGVWLFAFLIGGWLIAKVKGMLYMLVPFGVSYLVSRLLLFLFAGDWGYYFVPLGVSGTLVFMTCLSLLPLGIGALIGRAKKH